MIWWHSLTQRARANMPKAWIDNNTPSTFIWKVMEFKTVRHLCYDIFYIPSTALFVCCILIMLLWSGATEWKFQSDQYAGTVGYMYTALDRVNEKYEGSRELGSRNWWCTRSGPPHPQMAANRSLYEAVWISSHNMSPFRLCTEM